MEKEFAKIIIKSTEEKENRKVINSNNTLHTNVTSLELHSFNCLLSVCMCSGAAILDFFFFSLGCYVCLFDVKTCIQNIPTYVCAIHNGRMNS